MYIRFTYFSNVLAIYRGFVSAFGANSTSPLDVLSASISCRGVNEKQTFARVENLHLLSSTRSLTFVDTRPKGPWTFRQVNTDISSLFTRNDTVPFDYYLKIESWNTRYRNELLKIYNRGVISKKKKDTRETNVLYTYVCVFVYFNLN